MRAVLVLAALLAACKNETPEAAELRWRSTLEKELTAATHRGPGAAIKPEPVASAVTTPGPAYLAMSEGGIVKLDSGAVTVLESPPDIRMLATSPTGELYALTAESVYKLVDATLERLGPEKISKQYGARIAVVPEGRLWLADGDTARYWTGSDWKETGKAFPDDEEYARSIAIDGKGRVYVSSKAMIVVHDQDTWKPVFDLRGVHIDGRYPSPTSWSS